MKVKKTWSLIISLILCFTMLVTLTACEPTDPQPDPDEPKDEVKFTIADITVNEGAVADINVVSNNTEYAVDDIEFTLPEGATDFIYINNAGTKVTGVAEGSVDVKATITSNDQTFEATFKVTVVRDPNYDAIAILNTAGNFEGTSLNELGWSSSGAGIGLTTKEVDVFGGTGSSLVIDAEGSVNASISMELKHLEAGDYTLSYYWYPSANNAFDPAVTWNGENQTPVWWYKNGSYNLYVIALTVEEESTVELKFQFTNTIESGWSWGCLDNVKLTKGVVTEAQHKGDITLGTGDTVDLSVSTHPEYSDKGAIVYSSGEPSITDVSYTLSSEDLGTINVVDGAYSFTAGSSAATGTLIISFKLDGEEKSFTVNVAVEAGVVSVINTAGSFLAQPTDTEGVLTANGWEIAQGSDITEGEVWQDLSGWKPSNVAGNTIGTDGYKNEAGINKKFGYTLSGLTFEAGKTYTITMYQTTWCQDMNLTFGLFNGSDKADLFNATAIASAENNMQNSSWTAVTITFQCTETISDVVLAVLVEGGATANTWDNGIGLSAITATETVA